MLFEDSDAETLNLYRQDQKRHTLRHTFVLNKNVMIPLTNELRPAGKGDKFFFDHADKRLNLGSGKITTFVTFKLIKDSVVTSKFCFCSLESACEHFSGFYDYLINSRLYSLSLAGERKERPIITELQQLDPLFWKLVNNE